VLARSPLAGSAELDLLAALNNNAALDRYDEAAPGDETTRSDR
jgi:hypothetical protein